MKRKELVKMIKEEIIVLTENTNHDIIFKYKNHPDKLNANAVSIYKEFFILENEIVV